MMLRWAARPITWLLLPLEGWGTAALLLLTLLVVVGSVARADWVKTPSLVFVVFLAILTATLLAKARWAAVSSHLLGLAIGLLVVMWQVGTLLQGTSFLAIDQLQFRLNWWLTTAAEGGISTDNLPFALFLTALTWLVGYISAWALFRHRNYWIALLPGGLGLLTNLSYLPERFAYFFFLYIFTALLLISWMHLLSRSLHWRRRGTRESEFLRLRILNNVVWFAGAILLTASLLPVGGPMSTLMESYEVLRSPLERFQSHFNRLFAALPGRKPVPNRAFSSVLPFQGTITLGTQPVLEAKASRPWYWRVYTYSVYTPSGWLTGSTERVPEGWIPPLSLEEEYRQRERLHLTVMSSFSRSTLFTGGPVMNVDGPETEWESYDNPVYYINLEEAPAHQELPKGLQEVAQALQRATGRLAPSGNAHPSPISNPSTPEEVQQLLPPDLVLLDAQWREGNLAEVQVATRLPAPADVLAVKSTSRLKASESYQVTGSFSVATPQELRRAGVDYPSWVRDRYTQLPPSLPERVRALASEVTAEAPTPYDKAQALRDYLQSFPYTLEIEPPPFDGDGVDHFLFTLRRGYSDYFASAMVVMLRAVDVPARVVVGYLPGELTRRDTWLARDKDSHAWVEVYFPSYGWVEFEATPGRGLPETVAPTREPVVPIIGSEEEPVDDEDDEFLDAPLRLPAPLQGAPWYTQWQRWLLWAGLPLVLALALGYLWRWWMAPPPQPESLFRQLALLGALAGAGPRPSQTPYEYGLALRALLPTQQGEISTIVHAYVRSRYGRREPSAWERAHLAKAWRALRGLLLLRLLRRR
ncbi:MAG: DUF4129 domain-containing transglutaminase family protein [Dehalococcoidia bacterium]